MDRIDKILNNSTYKSCMQEILQAEKCRKFCCHGIEHSLDVARICYIINLENDLGYSKDFIYAMALLHDIGRCVEYKENISHHQAGAEIAKDILRDAGYNDNETAAICEAISNHKKKTDYRLSIDSVLYRADKLSRNCFCCEAYDECYWDEQLKNKTIEV